jgi:hypothetical protein
MRCEARARTTGRPCRAWAIVGTRRCKDHGSWSPQAAAKGQERATVAQLLQHEDPDGPRPVGEAMLDAFNTADVLHRSLREGRLRVARGEPVTGEELDRLVRMAQVVVHLGEQLARVGVGAELVRQARLAAEMNGAVIYRALGRAVDAQSRALRERGAPEELVILLREAAHEAALEELRAAEDPGYEDELRGAVLREVEGG